MRTLGFEPRPKAETGRASRDQSLPIRHLPQRDLNPRVRAVRQVAAATNPSPSAIPQQGSFKPQVVCFAGMTA
jgi:hypothetical protein